jgi:hypothetical protein
MALLLVLGLAACGGIVNFAPADEDSCDGKSCGAECDGGICNEDGVCSLAGDVVCAPQCVLGACADSCSICVGEDCVTGFCNAEGECVEGGVVCPN